MWCRINVTTTLEEHSIHVEEFDQPDSLLYANEGGNPVPVARQAWSRYIGQHPEDPVRVFHLQLGASLPRWRRLQIVRAAIFLLRKMLA